MDERGAGLLRRSLLELFPSQPPNIETADWAVYGAARAL
jgi:hypothetical protein